MRDILDNISESIPEGLRDTLSFGLIPDEYMNIDLVAHYLLSQKEIMVDLSSIEDSDYAAGELCKHEHLGIPEDGESHQIIVCKNDVDEGATIVLPNQNLKIPHHKGLYLVFPVNEDFPYHIESSTSKREYFFMKAREC